MPRKARQESSTDMYHVIMRGNNRKWIFKKEIHKEKMKKLIFNQVEMGLIEVYAWCIMDNHVHIVLRAKMMNMSKAMFNINRVFARHYNYKEKEVGHVFESRYKSKPAESDEYLMQVIRYIHNNPVKAKMVKKAEQYQWSSFKDYEVGNYRLLSIDLVKTYFNNSFKAFKEYHDEIDDNEYLEIYEDLQQDHR